MQLNVIEILVLVSLIQGFLFSVVILTQKKFRAKVNRFLAYNIFLVSYIGLIELLVAKGLDKRYYFIDYFGDDIPWLLLFYIPILIYFLKSVGNRFANSKKLFVLLIPFLIFWILYAIIDLQFDFELMDWNIVRDNYRTVYEFQFYFSMVFNVLLCTIAYFIIQKGDVSPDEKKWLHKIWLFNTALILVWVINTFIPDELYPFEHKDISYPIWLGVSVYVYWLIFKGLIHLNLSRDKSEIHEILVRSEIKKTDVQIYEPSTELSENGSVHFVNLLRLLEKEKSYRDPDLSREVVAGRLNISAGYLSQLIGTSGNSNFTSLINGYRVADVEWMLLNPEFDKYSIVAIGLEAGFRSKSTFYSEFKRKTGHTPSQFKVLKISPD